MLLDLTWLFLAIFVSGLFLTIVLYKFDIKSFIGSGLAVKILMWVPIYLGFLIFVSVGYFWQLTILALILIKSILESKHSLRGGIKTIFLVYWLAYFIGFIHIGLYPLTFNNDASKIIISIAFASVLSDVCAFFFGRFFGRHKLPAFISNKKSYEGVFGQVVGAFLGLVLVSVLITDALPVLMFIPVAIGAIAGDLTNSYVKRRAKLKEWGNGLPGHGGYMDRFASLGGSFLFTYYILLLFKL